MKKYVNIRDNRAFSPKHIKVGDSVIVTDGSYMASKSGGYVCGIDFREKQHIGCDRYQLLMVKQTNVRLLKTKGVKQGDTLCHLNNCVITDGLNDYYCSLINIVKFTS